MLDGRSPADTMRGYVHENATLDFLIDGEFGAVPIWDGADRQPGVSIKERGEKARSLLTPENSKKFLIRAYVAPASLAKLRLNDGEPVWSDPDYAASMLTPANQATGDTNAVREDLNTATLQDNGLYGGDVAVAIVDTGIYRRHLARQLGFNPALDVGNSWTPPTVATSPGFIASDTARCAPTACSRLPRM